MTDDEVMKALRDENGRFNRARVVLRGASVKLAAASGIRPMDMRRLEFEAVREIAKELGVSV